MEIEKENPLKTINDLENLNFYIPNYQRGYRWGKIEVNALLQDILDFYQTDRNKESFYCLQPIVVKKDSKRYKVIDGQQRLTTIFLIIKFLNNKDIFDINYQTRRESNDFLKNIQNKLDLEEIENIDFFYFLNAYKEIKKFFNDKVNEISKEEFLQTLLYSCKVLWYEISEQEKENEVFIRLNIGKIPLLEAENIKALFLAENENIDEDEQKERAEAWYEAEIKAREDNDFRYCVLNKIDEKNLMYNELGKPVIKDDILRVESYLKSIVPSSEILFNYFYKYYKDKTIDKKWEEFISSINTLESFSYKGVEKIDREIFHYIGYLILSGENIFDIYQFWLKNKDKHLILQPMTCAKELREFLYEEGYDILKENTVLSSNKVYSVMLARFSYTNREVHELYPYIGKILDNYDYSTGLYIKREIRDLKNKCKGLSAVKNKEAESELNKVINKLELLYKEYDHDNCTEHL